MTRVPPGARLANACSIAFRWPTASKAQSTPRPPVESLICWTGSPSRPSTRSVAPKPRASSSFAGRRSTAKIRPAPASTPPWITLSPIPPVPKTAIVLPASTLARFRTAPTPVMMPQPMSAAWGMGMPRGTGIALEARTTVSSAKVEAFAKL